MKTQVVGIVLLLVGMAQAVPPPLPESPVRIGGDDRLADVESRQIERARQLTGIVGTLIAQARIVASHERAYEETQDGIYLLHALHANALLLRDRIRLTGEAITNLAALDTALAHLPLDEVGVFIEQRLESVTESLARTRTEYHQAIGQADRQRLKASFVEVYAIYRSVLDLRKTLEQGDDAIRDQRARIASEIASLEGRLEKDAHAKGLLEARLPVVALDLEIDQLRLCLAEVEAATEPLDTPAISVSDPLIAETEAVRILEDLTQEFQQ